MQCNIRDITVQKAAEMGMGRLGAIVESSNDAIFGTDLDGIITNWNKGAETIFGYSAAEMVGTSIMRLIPADRQEEENQILGKFRRGEAVEPLETVRQPRTDGWWMSRSRPHRSRMPPASRSLSEDIARHHGAEETRI